ncbi:MAG: hypothetical protein JWR84_4025 [Caulobacter sp.]|nr:hypothetical protein [Caulobacter sp.]
MGAVVLVETAADRATWMAGEGLGSVAGRPGYRAAVRRHFQAWLAPQSESAVSRSLRHLSHYVSAIWVFYLDATPGGLTFSRLSELLDRSGVTSARRARPLLIYLQFIGYIEPAPTNDARVKRWRPTDRMAQAFRRRMAEDFAGMRAIDPDIEALAARFDQDAVFAAFMRAMGALTLALLARHQPEDDDLDLFSQRTAGMALMAELLFCGEPDGPFPPVGPIRYSIAGLARRNKVSRMHVRRLLAEAEKTGFLTQSGEGEAVLHPVLGQKAETLFVITVWSYNYCARAALEEAA